MQKIGKTVANWCQNNCQIAEQEYPIVEYGIQLLLNTSLKVIVILLIGWITGYLKEFIIAMSVFGGLRKFAGGVHCKTDLGCFSTMLFICVCPIAMFGVNLYLAKHIWRVISLYSLYQVIRYAPRNSKVNPIYDTRILKRNRIGSIVVTSIAVMFLFFCQRSNMGWLVALPLFIEAITVSSIFYREEK